MDTKDTKDTPLSGSDSFDSGNIDATSNILDIPDLINEAAKTLEQGVEGGKWEADYSLVIHGDGGRGKIGVKNDKYGISYTELASLKNSSEAGGLVTSRGGKVNFEEKLSKNVSRNYGAGVEHEHGPNNYEANRKFVEIGGNIGGAESKVIISKKNASYDGKNEHGEPTKNTSKTTAIGTKTGAEISKGVKFTITAEGSRTKKTAESEKRITTTEPTTNFKIKPRIEVDLTKTNNVIAAGAAMAFNGVMVGSEKLFETENKGAEKETIKGAQNTPTQPDNNKTNEKAEEAKKDAEAESKKQTEELKQEEAKETEEVKAEEAKQIEETQAEEAKQAEEYDYGYGY